MNIIFPLISREKQGKKAENSLPKMLVEYKGKPLFSWALQGLKPFFQKPYKLIFICLKRDLQHHSLLQQIKQHCPYPCTVFTLDSWPSSQTQTVLMAQQYIDNQQPLLIYYGDTFFDTGYRSWSPLQNSAGGIIWSIASIKSDSSYIKAKSDGTVVKVLKKTTSPYASIGLYFFRTGASFVQLVKKTSHNKIKVTGENDIEDLYNELIKQGITVKMETVKTCFPVVMKNNI
ncbi:hypothetical protein SAMN04488137_4584 [Fictibacillus solisalsi]|uniref:MobA-like NTP transferase domain-containing protein n=1 Tax=Fictibacillus solisalsi TaxID=459525 RepID=A0A1H0BNH1_9BACL|nr:hypothetical protein [Fictibacillus solisalsi]SDN47196.1 hypothetical protein SAMN04488137_4584 [Fictibacillus solisalsi]